MANDGQPDSSRAKDDNKVPAGTPSLTSQLAVYFILPLAAAVAGLMAEYWSGFFAPTASASERLSSPAYRSAIFVAAPLISSLFFVASSVSVYVRQYNYVREQFALVSLCAVASFALHVFTSILTGLTPWTFPYPLVQALTGREVSTPPTSWSDYALLLTLLALLVVVFSHLHGKWRGLKSVQQYRRDQQGDAVGFFYEGWLELHRLARRERPLDVYAEASPKNFIPQLEPVADLLSWREQARELVRLSSSSYSFDPVAGWHDKENCWVGENVNTGDMVVIYPHQERLSEGELERVLDYSRLIAGRESKSVSEVIFASKSSAAMSDVVRAGAPVRHACEESLLEGLVDFKDYFNEIRRRVSVDHLPESTLALEDVYVPSRFVGPDGAAAAGSSIEEYLTGWLGEAGQRQLALLGEYGQGKSTAALLWAYHLISAGPGAAGRIPLLIELRGTSPRNLTPLQLIGAWASQYNMNPQALMRLIVAGKFVLIFEGFDEMALVGDAEMRLKHFRTLWQFAYPKSKILITGRPNFFLDEEEMKAALGINKPIGARPYCEALRLAPFDPEQINEALRAYKPTVRGQIHALVLKNARFRELVSRPSLLHIVAVLWERERLIEKVDQLTSAYVMDSFIRHSYRRQGLKEVDSPDFMALTTLERGYFMSGIASYMAAAWLPNQISGTKLNEVITNLIDAIPDSVSAGSSAILGETTQPLRRRIESIEYGVEGVRTDVRACGLLTDDPAAPGTFRFGHKSFMEYLFAAVLAERIQNPASDKANAVLKTTNARIDNIMSLPVAIEFLSELLIGARGNTAAADSKADYSTANLLFKAIVSDKSFSPTVRPAAFLETVTCCLAGRTTSYWLVMLIRMVPMIFPMLLSVLLWTLIFYSPGSPPQTFFEEVNSRPVSFALVIILFCMPFLMTPIFPNPTVRRRLKLWRRICSTVGISDRILHRVLGTNLIPLVREMPIIYPSTFAPPDFREDDSETEPTGGT